jgi:hypothetical protein
VGAGLTSAATGLGGTIANAVRGIPSGVAEAYKRLGIVPQTVGAVTENPHVRQAEAIAAGLPGGARLRPAQAATAEQIGDAAETTAAKLGDARTAHEAGTKTQELLRDWRSNTWKNEQETAWQPLNQRMSGAGVDPSGYRRALQQAAKDPALDSLPENQRVFANKLVQEWLAALDADAPPGRMLSWEQAHALKKKIGDQLGSPDIVSSLGNKALQGIYGGLAEDMGTTARAHGQGRVFDAANKVTIDGHNFIDTVVTKAIQKNNAGQETVAADIAARNMLGSNDAMMQLRQRVPEAANELGAYRLREIKEAVPSQQGADSTSSSGSLLTKLRGQQIARPEGSEAMFRPVAGDVYDLAKVAANQRLMEQQLNRPNTAAGVASALLMSQLWAAYQSGGPRAAAGVLAANAGAPGAISMFMRDPRIIAMAGARKGTRPVPGLLGAINAVPNAINSYQPDDQR